MRKLTLSAFAAGTAFLLASPAHADITGTVDATITLQAGCIVNGQNFSDGAAGADFGTLDFGTHNTLFSQADGQVLSGGGGAFTIQCSPGITPVLPGSFGRSGYLGRDGCTILARSDAEGDGARKFSK